MVNSITKIIIIYCQHVNIVTRNINITLLQSLKRTTANSILPGISVGNHYPAVDKASRFSIRRDIWILLSDTETSAATPPGVIQKK